MTSPDHDLAVDIAGTRVLFVMAVAAEYGDHLRKRFDPQFIGVGPVEAAINTTAALISDRPDLVVSLGSAGARRLEQGRVYQATSVSYRDMDASPLGFEKGCTPFLDLPADIVLPYQISGVPSARLSTGANIVSGNAYDAIDADMVDMESFAVVRACMERGVPAICLRGISDGAGELHHYDDWAQYLHVVDENLAAAIDHLRADIQAGRIAS
ncbi:5'-methylthioadenosine/S-adenosylhomocysteine nucleosidase [Pseudohoeflea suaedae]|uniref:5'-methylthioadenosine/S-adenosylhomocysteine nucleosidase n=1 Tax=Pseudohoeflea suaedae TaxID=877384 RepID=A0A4R5PLT3_9HYPH|nr:5'-methylthioadenosine/S-adenosylhomocysteine nucleosidase [Pseudohoeflea suaedae]TDH37893.1 5'-methylthioadenosine/S-adenosylhomocysteine nucleosidase [Pseudohoeflea suaedae]